MDKADIDLYLGTIEERMREVRTNGPEEQSRKAEGERSVASVARERFQRGPIVDEERRAPDFDQPPVLELAEQACDGLA